MVSIQLQGGLSNQMFMSAFIWVYAKKHDLDYCIPKNVLNPHVAGKAAYEFPGFKYCDTEPDLPIVTEPHFHYTEFPRMDNVKFFGYFQSWRYFDEYREKLLEALGFAWRHKKEYCSVHVRRDDYLQQSEYHPPVTEKYLYEAMKNVAGKQPEIIFRVFSDDILWCKETFSLPGFSQFNIQYSEGTHEVEELEKMSCCSHQICANSAFSWWAAYLNQNPDKIIIMPERWFGEALRHYTRDLYLPGAIIPLTIKSILP